MHSTHRSRKIPSPPVIPKLSPEALFLFFCEVKGPFPTWVFLFITAAEIHCLSSNPTYLLRTRLDALRIPLHSLSFPGLTPFFLVGGQMFPSLLTFPRRASPSVGIARGLNCNYSSPPLRSPPS